MAWLHTHFVRIGLSVLIIAVVSLCGSPDAQALMASELSLELSASYVASSDGRANAAFFVQVNVPLDPRRPSPAHEGLLQEEQTAPVEDVPLDALERDNVESAEVDPNDAAWGDAVAPSVSTAEPLSLDRQFLSEVTEAALAAQGCDDAWLRLESLGTRNRVSALLPEVALRAGRERDTTLRLTPTDTDPYRYTMSGATNLLLEGRLSWRLGRLLFSTEDLGIERLRLARSRERQRVVERTIAILFRWLRAQSALASGRKLTARQTRAAKWERTQSEMRLDVLTAGWFSTHLPTYAPTRAPNIESSTTSAPMPLVIAPQPSASAPSKTNEAEPAQATAVNPGHSRSSKERR